MLEELERLTLERELLLEEERFTVEREVLLLEEPRFTFVRLEGADERAELTDDRRLVFIELLERVAGER